jgi:hypothetical protein
LGKVRKVVLGYVTFRLDGISFIIYLKKTQTLYFFLKNHDKRKKCKKDWALCVSVVKNFYCNFIFCENVSFDFFFLSTKTVV